MLDVHDYIFMTMDRSDKTMPAGEFKAKCLRVLDEVERTGRAVVVTKRGRAVARVVSLEKPKKKPGQAPLAGSVVYEGDIVSPLGEPWAALA